MDLEILTSGIELAKSCGGTNEAFGAPYSTAAHDT
jgi:hypothetical protein